MELTKTQAKIIAANPSFKAFYGYNSTASKIAKNVIFEAYTDIDKLAQDVDITIIGKKGLFSKIKSLIFFVTPIGKKTGEWHSLSIDPKGFLPTEHRYTTVKNFTRENIIDSIKSAKNRLAKRNPELPKSFLPADAVYLKKFVDLFKTSCKI